MWEIAGKIGVIFDVEYSSVSYPPCRKEFHLTLGDVLKRNVRGRVSPYHIACMCSLLFECLLLHPSPHTLNSPLYSTTPPQLTEVPWMPRRHRTFGPGCHAVLRTLCLGIRRLRKDEASPLAFVDPAALEMIFEGLRRNNFDSS